MAPKFALLSTLPLKQVVLSGEVRCPLKAGHIALEACVTIQDRDDAARCKALKCAHTAHKLVFIDEIKQARDEEVAPRKEPAKRPWLIKPTS